MTGQGELALRGAGVPRWRVRYWVEGTRHGARSTVKWVPGPGGVVREWLSAEAAEAEARGLVAHFQPLMQDGATVTAEAVEAAS